MIIYFIFTHYPLNSIEYFEKSVQVLKRLLECLYFNTNKFWCHRFYSQRIWTSDSHRCHFIFNLKHHLNGFFMRITRTVHCWARCTNFSLSTNQASHAAFVSKACQCFCLFQFILLKKKKSLIKLFFTSCIKQLFCTHSTKFSLIL